KPCPPRWGTVASRDLEDRSGRHGPAVATTPGAHRADQCPAQLVPRARIAGARAFPRHEAAAAFTAFDRRRRLASVVPDRARLRRDGRGAGSSRIGRLRSRRALFVPAADPALKIAPATIRSGGSSRTLLKGPGPISSRPPRPPGVH